MTQHQAEWMWYPGEFEIWLRREVELRRDERQIITPPIWRVDSPYPVVRFKKTVRLERPEQIDVWVDGALRLVIDGTMLDRVANRVALSAGEHAILAEVTNTARFPALFVRGTTVVSDDSWQVSYLYHTGYVAAATAGLTDPAAPPADFRLATQPLEPQAIQRDSGGVLVDFGKETFGYLRLHGIRGAGQIRLQYGESPEEAQDADHCETYDVVTHDAGDGTERTVAHTRALRYVRVIPEDGIHVEHVSLLYEYLPLSYRGTFRCSDELLNQIFEVAAYTLHLNTREFFLDGIKRDRWLWSGDAYQSYLMNYYLFFDLGVVRRTTVALRGKNPVEEHLNTILDYSLYWFMGLRDYYDYTGDLDFIRQQYPNMLSLIAFCVERTNGEGMLEGQPGDWVFVDWADMPKDGALTFEQLLFCLSLDTVVLFAELLGDEATVARYRPRATRLREAIRATFWDAARGAFIHRQIKGQPDPRITKHPTMIALLYGFLTPEERAQVKATVLQNPAVPAITTPYMRFYELAAMCEAGEHAYVLDEIRQYWGGMLRLGATSFWEEYDPQIGLPEQYAMYGRPFGKSLCHAWGASPIYLFGKYFLGVTPAAPGYRETRIQPQLGNLEWIEGAVPTPHGDVQVFMDQQAMRVAIPHGSAILRFSSAVPPSATVGQLMALGGSDYELRFDETSQLVEVYYKAVVTNQ